MKTAVRQRDPRQIDRDYKGWIAGLRCVACAYNFVTTYGVHVAHIRMSDAAAGWRNTGMQEKPHDRRTAPLCPKHHTQGPAAQHQGGERAFWERININPPELCQVLSDAFDAGRDGNIAIARFAARARRDKCPN